MAVRSLDSGAGPLTLRRLSSRWVMTATVAIVLIPISIITLGIGSILYLPLTVLIIVFSIIAAVKANQGQPYTYPLTIKFVS